mmetsp:Transcript_62531/g.182828  ORF Transcript_62531/g.182828 Transcript_62531/m.182828 type:complete len:387 (+) Transcript_62531:79-1239(+)
MAARGEEEAALLRESVLERRPRWERAAWAGLLGWAAIATALAVSARLPPQSAGANLGRPLLADTAARVQATESGSADPGLYDVYTTALKGAKYVDLTHAFSPQSPVWSGFGQASFGPAKAGAGMEGFVEKGEEFSYAKHGFQATSFVLTTDQYGTQLDPPAHWNEYGATISDIPPTVALRPLVVLDIHDKVAKNASYHAMVEDAKVWEKVHGRIPQGSVVMIRSDWSKGWQRFAKEGLPAEYAGVSLDLLKFLHRERKILFHGHEPLDTDMTATLEGEAWLMHNNFAQAEGVTNLHLVPQHGCLLSIGFAKPLGGLGGFARYVAICPAGAAHGETVEQTPGAPLQESRQPLRRTGGVMLPDAGAEPTEYCKTKGALGCAADGPVWK